MNGRKRVPLGEVLRATLPGYSEDVPGAGRGAWSSAAGAASWELEPEGEAFWLVLTGRLDAVEPLEGLFRAARRWPWPLKVACRAPGEPPCWCAEVRLTGVSGDARTVARLAVGVDRWLTGVGGPSDGEPDPAPAPGAEAEEALTRGLGPALKRTARGFRLPADDGPALTVVPGRGVWVFRAMLVRAESGPEGLYDFMAVANGRVRGCRVLADGEGEVAGAAAETRLSYAESPSAADAAARLARAARRVAPACEVLTGQPRVDALYRELCGGVAARA